MKTQVIFAVATFLLAGCTSDKPGAFERVDEDPASNTVQYRFNPKTVDKTALEIDLAHYCSARGFDRVEPLPAQDSHLPGLKKAWYQCNYALKG
ncbi:hypothetical protein PMPD1_3167 [Paramixta manurensis]|uniref:Lipoprotein n=1 Tax=Paramixta manurensis TaxID=2740817 RepID=A0A6M8UET2_9GAMM|nr:hypothetical protein PMPD1_3167 [Erwiniaceae bacterium PD-1]